MEEGARKPASPARGRKGLREEEGHLEDGEEEGLARRLPDALERELGSELDFRALFPVPTSQSVGWTKNDRPHPESWEPRCWIGLLQGRRCGPRPGASSLKWGPGGAPQTSIQPANEGLVTPFSSYSSTPAPCVQTPHLLATKYRLWRPACPRSLAGSGCHLISHLPLQRECMGLRCSLPGLAGGFGLDRVQPELRTGPPAQTLPSQGGSPHRPSHDAGGASSPGLRGGACGLETTQGSLV